MHTFKIIFITTITMPLLFLAIFLEAGCGNKKDNSNSEHKESNTANTIAPQAKKRHYLHDTWCLKGDPLFSFKIKENDSLMINRSISGYSFKNISIKNTNNGYEVYYRSIKYFTFRVLGPSEIRVTTTKTDKIQRKNSEYVTIEMLPLRGVFVRNGSYHECY